MVLIMCSNLAEGNMSTIFTPPTAFVTCSIMCKNRALFLHFLPMLVLVIISFDQSQSNSLRLIGEPAFERMELIKFDTSSSLIDLNESLRVALNSPHTHAFRISFQWSPNFANDMPWPL